MKYENREPLQRYAFTVSINLLRDLPVRAARPAWARSARIASPRIESPRAASNRGR